MSPVGNGFSLSRVEQTRMWAAREASRGAERDAMMNLGDARRSEELKAKSAIKKLEAEVRARDIRGVAWCVGGFFGGSGGAVGAVSGALNGLRILNPLPLTPVATAVLLMLNAQVLVIPTVADVTNAGELASQLGGVAALPFDRQAIDARVELRTQDVLLGRAAVAGREAQADLQTARHAAQRVRRKIVNELEDERSTRALVIESLSRQSVRSCLVSPGAVGVAGAAIARARTLSEDEIDARRAIREAALLELQGRAQTLELEREAATKEKRNGVLRAGFAVGEVVARVVSDVLTAGSSAAASALLGAGSGGLSLASHLVSDDGLWARERDVESWALRVSAIEATLEEENRAIESVRAMRDRQEDALGAALRSRGSSMGGFSMQGVERARLEAELGEETASRADQRQAEAERAAAAAASIARRRSADGERNSARVLNAFMAGVSTFLSLGKFEAVRRDLPTDGFEIMQRFMDFSKSLADVIGGEPGVKPLRRAEELQVVERRHEAESKDARARRDQARESQRGALDAALEAARDGQIFVA